MEVVSKPRSVNVAFFACPDYKAVGWPGPQGSRLDVSALTSFFCPVVVVGDRCNNCW